MSRIGNNLANADLRPGLAVILPKDKPKETQGGIILSDWTERRHEFGQIANVNDDKFGLQTGDWVVFNRMSGIEFENDAREPLILVRTDEIQAVWE